MRYNICLLASFVSSTAGSAHERMTIHVPAALSAKFKFITLSCPEKQPGVLITNVEFSSTPSFTVRTSPITASHIMTEETSALVHDLLTNTIRLDTLAVALDSIIIDAGSLIRQEVKLTRHYMDLWDIRENQIAIERLQLVPCEDRASDVQLRNVLVERVAPIVRAAFGSFVASLDISMAASTFVQSVFDFEDKQMEADVIASLSVDVGAACESTLPSILKLVVNKAMDSRVVDVTIMESIQAAFSDFVATHVALIKLSWLPMPSFSAINLNGPYAVPERNAYVSTVSATERQLRCLGGSSIRFNNLGNHYGENPLTHLDSSVFKRFGDNVPKLPLWDSLSHPNRHQQSAYLMCRYLDTLTPTVESTLSNVGLVIAKKQMPPSAPFDVNVKKLTDVEIVLDQCKLSINGLDYYGLNPVEIRDELLQVFVDAGVDPCMSKASLVALPEDVDEAQASTASVDEDKGQTILSCYSARPIPNQVWSVASDHATNPFNAWFGFWTGFTSIPSGFNDFKSADARGDLDDSPPIKTEANLRFYCETLFHIRSLAQDHILSKVVRSRVGRRSRAASDVTVEMSGSKISVDLRDMQYGSTLSLTLPAIKGATEDKVVNTVEGYAAVMSIDDAPKNVAGVKVRAIQQGLEEGSPRGTLTCEFDGKVCAEYGFIKAIMPDKYNPFYGGVSRDRMLQFCRVAYDVRMRIIEQINN